MTKTIADTEKDYQNNNEEIVQKMKADKAKALEEINVAGQDAAKATANLRSDAEAFTLKAKDQWKNHYQRTEIALREKSDKSSAHVSALQEKTGEKDLFYHYRPGQPNWENTMWKFQDFSAATQILLESIHSQLEAPKNCHFDH